MAKNTKILIGVVVAALVVLLLALTLRSGEDGSGLFRFKQFQPSKIQIQNRNPLSITPLSISPTFKKNTLLRKKPRIR